MSNINRVVISGRLTRDPELRATAGGTSLLSMCVAVNERRRDPKTGEWGDCPNFVDCTVFGPRAESLARMLSKGSHVTVEGRLRWSEWESGGQRRSKLGVVAEELELEPRAARPSQPQAAPQGRQPADPGLQPCVDQAFGAGYYGDEIPF